MATTFEPSTNVNSVQINFDNGTSYNIGRLGDQWLLQGGPRADFQQSNIIGDTFGEMYDLLVEYNDLISGGIAAMNTAAATAEATLAAEIAALLPQPE
jgi:hypothetical protein